MMGQPQPDPICTSENLESQLIQSNHNLIRALLRRLRSHSTS
jgi:hypothetical protein